MNENGTQGPNIVMVLVDDQGYGDLGCHGHPVAQTPEIDRFASESARLTDFHVHPMCTPTRGCLMTGMDALRHRATNVTSGRAMLSRDLKTLPEYLRDAGYETALFGKWHLGDVYPYRPCDRGFDKSIWFPSSYITSTPDRWCNDYFDPWFRVDHGDTAQQFDGYCTDVLFDNALEWIKERSNNDTPFFAYLPLNALHSPLLVENRYRERYAEHGHDAATYYGMIANLDENFGRLVREMKSLGVYDNTILVYMSDNGPTRFGASLFNAGMRGAKQDLYEGGHRVPSFWHWAEGIPREVTTEDIGSLLCAQDVLPTISDLCGIELTSATDGVSFAGLLRGDGSSRPPEDRTIVIQYSRVSKPPTPVKGDAAVMRGPWRLVNNTELYNVHDDPSQQRDIAESNEEIVASLRRYYSSWWHSLEDPLGGFLDIPVGGDPDDRTTVLTATDWRDVILLDQQRLVRAGVPDCGDWGIEVVRPGVYRIELRRWPKEADIAITERAPVFVGGDCIFPEGRALPIARATLRIGGREFDAPVGSDDVSATFEVELQRGRFLMRGSFLDSTDNLQCGAYYAYVLAPE